MVRSTVGTRWQDRGDRRNSRRLQDRDNYLSDYVIYCYWLHLDDLYLAGRTSWWSTSWAGASMVTCTRPSGRGTTSPSPSRHSGEVIISFHIAVKLLISEMRKIIGGYQYFMSRLHISNKTRWSAIKYIEPALSQIGRVWVVWSFLLLVRLWVFSR